MGSLSFMGMDSANVLGTRLTEFRSMRDEETRLKFELVVGAGIRLLAIGVALYALGTAAQAFFETPGEPLPNSSLRFHQGKPSQGPVETSIVLRGCYPSSAGMAGQASRIGRPVGQVARLARLASQANHTRVANRRSESVGLRLRKGVTY